MGWFGCKCDRSCNCGKQKGMIRREKVGGREGRGEERRGDIDMVVFTTGRRATAYIRFFFVFMRVNR